MRILQINSWFPLWSTGKLASYIDEYLLQNGAESYVFFGRGPKLKDLRYQKFCSTFEAKFNSVLSRITGICYGGNYFSTKELIKKIKKIKPDIIHIHCINVSVVNNYTLLKFLGENNYKVVITLHAEYPYTGNCGYAFDCNQWIDGCQKCPDKKRATRSWFFDNTKVAWKKMNKAFQFIHKNNRTVVAVSNWLNQRALLSKTFREDEIVTIENGIDTSVFTNRNNDNPYFYLKEKGIKNILFITPQFNPTEGNIKGCDTFLRIAKDLKNDNSIRFIVVGENIKNYDFNTLGNVIFLGPIHDQTKLAEIYSVCDATILLSRRETFSLVTAESISCETPIIGLKSGAPETIALDGVSFFFEQSDVGGLITFLKSNDYLNLDKSLFVKDYYSYKRMCKRYLDTYKKML